MLKHMRPWWSAYGKTHFCYTGVAFHTAVFLLFAFNCFAHALAAGKPTSMIIAEVADMYAFAAKCIGAQWIGKAKN